MFDVYSYTTRGLIPAHAGKTQPRVVDGLLDRAHPRSRGENPDCGVRVFLSEGSSPLTRGKPLGLGGRVVPPGLIPAHAGKTRQRASHTGGRPAHPRSRGENAFAAGHDTDIDGSSPLTRGKLTRYRGCARVWRLIPAHAGKTLCSPPRRTAGGAHPRSRGENVRPAARGVAYDGSSPLTRGKPTDKVCGGVGHGLIPAHAGKTRSGTR